MALAKEYLNSAVGEVDGKERTSNLENSDGGNFLFRNMSYQPDLHYQVPLSLINFKSGIGNLNHKISNESLLSFEPDVLSPSAYHWDCAASDHRRLMEEPNCFQTASNMRSPGKESKTGDGFVCDWLYTEATDHGSDGIHEAETHEGGNQKRPHMGESTAGVCKRLCTSATKKPKTKSTTKDPQSIAAKNRRERISERLKILQELVPNGSKVDLVTMLEKAISYVKFLQLQVKILATDEFWPVQGGKAPDISQVKEAIDAILSSQRERSSSSNSGK